MSCNLPREVGLPSPQPVESLAPKKDLTAFLQHTCGVSKLATGRGHFLQNHLSRMPDLTAERVPKMLGIGLLLMVPPFVHKSYTHGEPSTC